MGSKRLQFKTKPNINGHVFNVTIDVDNKEFTRDCHISNSDFLTLTQKDYKSLIATLREFGFKEIKLTWRDL